MPSIFPFLLERGGRKLLDDASQEVLVKPHLGRGPGAICRQVSKTRQAARRRYRSRRCTSATFPIDYPAEPASGDCALRVYRWMSDSAIGSGIQAVSYQHARDLTRGIGRGKASDHRGHSGRVVSMSRRSTMAGTIFLAIDMAETL